MSGSDTRALVEGYLGRPVQDALEAAVVLEAWGGVPADAALTLGREAATGAPTVDQVPDDPVSRSVFDRRSVASDVAFIVGVLFVGFWLSHRTDRFAVNDIDRAWRLALPTSLAAQWFLRRRVFLGGEGLGRLRREFRLLIPAGLVVFALAVVPDGGVLAVALAVLWIAGFVVSRRGWGLAYGATLICVLAVGGSARTAVPVLAFVCLATVTLAVVALRTTPPSDRLPGALARAIPSALIGGGLALFLVSEPRFSWAASGLLSAFTVVPSLLGSLAGGLWMTRLWNVLPPALRGISVGPRRRFTGSSSVGLFVQAVAIVLAVASTCSLFVLWRSSDDSVTTETTQVLLIAHAALAVAGLCVALLETLGRWGHALFATTAGVAAAFFVVRSGLLNPHPQAGVRILLGALVALAVALPGVLAVLGRPDHRIAAFT